MAHQLKQFDDVGPAPACLGFFSAKEEVEEIVVGQIHQGLHGLGSCNGQALFMPLEKACDEQVVFEQSAAAPPFELAEGPLVQQRVSRPLGREKYPHYVERGLHGQTALRTISSLILPIALVGFKFLGQTSTQFMIE